MPGNKSSEFFTGKMESSVQTTEYTLFMVYKITYLRYFKSSGDDITLLMNSEIKNNLLEL